MLAFKETRWMTRLNLDACLTIIDSSGLGFMDRECHFGRHRFVLDQESLNSVHLTLCWRLTLGQTNDAYILMHNCFHGVWPSC